jgi:hypothetical protein
MQRSDTPPLTSNYVRPCEPHLANPSLHLLITTQNLQPELHSSSPLANFLWLIPPFNISTTQPVHESNGPIIHAKLFMMQVVRPRRSEVISAMHARCLNQLGGQEEGEGNNVCMPGRFGQALITLGSSFAALGNHISYRHFFKAPSIFKRACHL